MAVKRSTKTKKESEKHDGHTSGRSTSKSSQSASGGSHSNAHSSKTTTDHDEIRQWAEARGGQPACVKGTGGSEDVGLLRLEFPGAPQSHDEKLQKISWDEFFEKFDDQALALVYQDELAEGGESNFNKLVRRETARKAAGGR